MTRWLSIIGIGEDGYDALTPAARSLVEGADLVIGGKRHLAMLPSENVDTMAWPSPIHDAIQQLADHRDKKVCVLATGDPFCYGIGRLIAAHIPMDEITVIPSPSAFSLASSRLGWAFQDVDLITLHGRAYAHLEPVIQPDAKLLILSQNAETPRSVASRLIARGFETSKITVLERLGSAKERIRGQNAEDWSYDDSDTLHVIVVHCISGPNAQCLSRLSVLPDTAFGNDGQLTKQEVRAATLAALSGAPGQLLWDVGAGCGSIGIEWMRRERRCRAIAIEPEPKRLDFIAKNATALGTPSLEIISGQAPAALTNLEEPHAIFIGGGISNDNVFETCWRKLLPGGTLVANAVTVESERTLLSLQATYGGDLKRIAIVRATPVGSMTGWKPFMPVTQWNVTKPRVGVKS